MADDTHISMMQEAETEGTGRRKTLRKTIGKVVFWAIVALLGLRFLYLIGGSDGPSVATTTPSATRPAATQAEVVYPPNTSKECPGDIALEPLTESKKNISSVGCHVYWRVIEGRILLSGAFLGDIEDGPEGGVYDDRMYLDVRAKNGSATWKRIRCVGAKQNPRDGKWSC